MAMSYKEKNKMLRRQSLALLLSACSFSVFAGFDVDQMKQKLDAEKVALGITSWQKEGDSWLAASSIRGVRVKVNDQRVEMVTPHINYKKAAVVQARCEAIGNLLLASDAVERKQVASVVRQATQYHRPKVANFEGWRFEVKPVLKTTHVRLSCVLRQPK
jgi:hypothetical protein